MKLPGAVVIAMAAWAQPETREKPTSFPASIDLAEFAIGAEYMGRQFFAEGKAYDSGDFIAVEVGLFPNPGTKLEVAASRFALKLNGKRSLVYAQSTGTVSNAMRMKPWDNGRRRLEVGGGVGGADVVVGRPTRTERFPGDNQGRMPSPPRAPAPDYQANVERPPEEPIGDLLTRAGLPEGPADKMVRGYLFFPYSGKLASLKRVELVSLFENSGGSLAIKKPR
jgi:hypothetical protein